MKCLIIYMEFFRNAFTDLMTSGTLTSQSHISIPTSSQDFPGTIQKICQTYRLTGWRSNRLNFTIHFFISLFSCRTNQFRCITLCRNSSRSSNCSSNQISCMLNLVYLLVKSHFVSLSEFSKWSFNWWQINWNAFSFEFNGRDQTFSKNLNQSFVRSFVFSHSIYSFFLSNTVIFVFIEKYYS